jgi:outer membrane murein-binding lipoprotein Lpp
MTKAEEVHQRIDALVGGGMQKADAFRTLAEETGKPVKSLQGAYYTHARKTGTGGSSRARKRETTPADALGSAIAVLERALEDIDAEIEVAKDRAAEAKSEYESLKGSAASRKQALQTKIEALRA